MKQINLWGVNDMPLPLLLAGVAIAAGGWGIKKGVDAKSDYDDAAYWNSRAEEDYEDSQRKLEEAREKTVNSMESLGELKFHIYETSMIPFVENFSKIKNIKSNINALLDTNLSDIDINELEEMKHTALEMKDVVGGGIAALGSGGLAGLAAYGGIGVLGTASTGTAIGSLSGVAATNATLAWLGGGSIATGGLGMAGGTMVLGGIVAGPVLAVGGMIMASKAEAAKNDAYSNYDKAKLAIEEMELAIVATNGIEHRFNEMCIVLEELNKRFQPLNDSLIQLIKSESTKNKSIFRKITAHIQAFITREPVSYISYKDLTGEQQIELHMTTNIAITINNILKSKVINEDGNITDNSSEAIELGRNLLEDF